MNFEVKRIDTEAELLQFGPVIRQSFITVADEMGLTKKTAPSNPAFVSDETLQTYLHRGVCFGGYLDGDRVAFVMVKKTKEQIFSIENLCVVPKHRHLQIGMRLLRYAENYVIEQNGTRINIGIIDLNKKLKQWYKENGYIELSKMRFPHLPFDVCFMRKTVHPSSAADDASDVREPED